MAVTKNIKAVLLDFDGTLVSLSINWTELKAEIKEYFAQFGIIEDYTPILQRIESSINKATEMKKKTEKLIRKDIEKIFEKHESKNIHNSTIVPYADQFLNALFTKKIHIIIVTRNGNRIVKDMFRKYKFPNPTIIYSRNSHPIKPDRELATVILNKFSLTNDECIIVGDTEIDKLFGINSNIKTYILNEDFKSFKELVEILYA